MRGGQGRGEGKIVKGIIMEGQIVELGVQGHRWERGVRGGGRLTSRPTQPPPPPTKFVLEKHVRGKFALPLFGPPGTIMYLDENFLCKIALTGQHRSISFIPCILMPRSPYMHLISYLPSCCAFHSHFMLKTFILHHTMFYHTSD